MIDPPVALDSFSFNCWVLPAQYAALQTWGSEMIHRGVRKTPCFARAILC